MFYLTSPISDVILKVERKKIPAHKVVLHARCEVLSAMFSEGFLESETSMVKFQYGIYVVGVLQYWLA